MSPCYFCHCLHDSQLAPLIRTLKSTIHTNFSAAASLSPPIVFKSTATSPTTFQPAAEPAVACLTYLQPLLAPSSSSLLVRLQSFFVGFSGFMASKVPALPASSKVAAPALPDRQTVCSFMILRTIVLFLS